MLFFKKKKIEPKQAAIEPALVNGTTSWSHTDSSEETYTQIGGVGRYLAWIFLALVIGLSVFLSFMIGNNARTVLLNKQYEFASLLSNNLNHQIYRRFTLPTLVGFGRIALRQPAQYERLDQVVRQVIHGMNVQELRIYDHGLGQMISYSLNKDVLGLEGLAPPAVTEAMTSVDPIFNLDAKLSYWQAFFTPTPEKGSFILRTTYPMRIENRLGSSSSEADGPMMGVLEFTQDITDEIYNVLRFQWSIIAIILVSSLLIFILLMFFLQRADQALAERVKEKERLQEQLHQHEKLAGMGRVIAGIAHEIRNPLGIICSSAQLLIGRSNQMDKSGVAILQAIYDESNRLSQTVTDFLDYARPRSPIQDKVELAKIIEQAVVFMDQELKRHKITLLRRSTDVDGLVIRGDKDLLYRAVYNVLSNAVQAVQHNGSGLIQVDIFTIEELGEAVIRVADNGPGFGTNEISQFVDPFFTTKPHGSGLGLPIVNSIISSHNGRLVLENQPEGYTGAVVSIILPKI